jgi:hypothetical protein
MGRPPHARFRTAPAHAWQCADLSLWVRVAVYALEHHARPLGIGELRRTLDPAATSAALSRAIRRGVSVGLLRPESTARQLYSTVAGRAHDEHATADTGPDLPPAGGHPGN